MKKIGLFGAAGAIGRSVASALTASGIPYRVIGRSRAALEAAFGKDPLAEIATWSPDDPESVRAAARGLSDAVHLVGVPYWQFAHHPVVMRQTLAGAIAEKVERLLLIGTVYPYGRPQTERVSETHPRAPHTFKGRMRKEQEDIVLEAHAQGAIQTTILRLPDFYGPGVERSFLADVFAAAIAGRRAKLIGPIDRPHEFVYVPDVGPVVTSLLAEPRAFGHTWNLAGAGVTTQHDLVARIFAETGAKPRYLTAGKTLLRLLGLRDPVMRELVEMHYLLTTPVLLDDAALQGLLGPALHKTPYDEGIRQSLAAARAEVRAQASSQEHVVRG
jgi:nucleoside-diphosphate-sugar epimerase